MRVAQRAWAQASLRARVRIIRRTRQKIATTAVAFAETVARPVADTLVAEVLPLTEACRFLEQEAAFLLAPQQISSRSRPFWLRKVHVETRREPLGLVLILAPANYPLFLPGVQALQALTAGNAVLFKPAAGGRPSAELLRSVLLDCGLDPALLTVLDDSTQAGEEAIAAGVDKVFLTGSAATGQAVMGLLAPHLTPSVMELSGCDAVFVLPGADRQRVLAALSFGLRLNGSATCMAPRRLFLVGDHHGLVDALLAQLENLPPAAVSPCTQQRLDGLLEDARVQGATLHRRPQFAVVRGARGNMRIAQEDISAPVLSIFEHTGVEEALQQHALCPYALTAAIFAPDRSARSLAERLPVNTVLINDVIVATADPRISFGGRRQSGFGFTRGGEGLLAMTTLKTVATQRSPDLRPYQPSGAAHTDFFAAYLQMAHAAGWRNRWQGMRRLAGAAARLKN